MQERGVFGLGGVQVWQDDDWKAHADTLADQPERERVGDAGGPLVDGVERGRRDDDRIGWRQHVGLARKLVVAANWMAGSQRLPASWRARRAAATRCDHRRPGAPRTRRGRAPACGLADLCGSRTRSPQTIGSGQQSASGCQSAEHRLVGTTVAVEKVQDKPLNGWLIVDFLWRQPLGLQQRVDRLAVLPHWAFAWATSRRWWVRRSMAGRPRRWTRRACSTARPPSPRSTDTETRWISTLVGPNTVQKSLRSRPSRFATDAASARNWLARTRSPRLAAAMALVLQSAP